MTCAACGTAVQEGGSYCPKCGRPQETRLLPVPVGPRSLAKRPSSLPPLVFGGLAALLAGKAAQWALREIASGLARGAVRDVGRALIPRPREATPPPRSTVAEGAGRTSTLPPGTRIVTRVWWQSEIYVPPAPDQKRRRWPFGVG